MLSNISLRTLAEEFIIYKQSIGYVYKTHRYYLMNYVLYAENHFLEINLPDKKSITGYLDALSDSSGSLYNATAVLREFGKYLSIRGCTDAYIIPAKSNPALDPEPPYFLQRKKSTFFSELAIQFSYIRASQAGNLYFPHCSVFYTVVDYDVRKHELCCTKMYIWKIVFLILSNRKVLKAEGYTLAPNYQCT